MATMLEVCVFKLETTLQINGSASQMTCEQETQTACWLDKGVAGQMYLELHPFEASLACLPHTAFPKLWAQNGYALLQGQEAFCHLGLG